MKTEKLKGPIISENFLSNVDHLIQGKTVIHHSHITGDVIGYAHSFCNLKVRENKNQVSVIAHNLFGFDFLFFLKGLRLGALNLSDINFAKISDQVKFIDMYKYYQQSLSVLASTMNNEERLSVRKECEKFIKKDPKLRLKFQACSTVDQEWILNYLSSGKEFVPYEMITRYDLLDIAPEKDSFFLLHYFHSSLKDSIINWEDYEAVNKLYCTLNLENLGELNKLYNFQDTIILAEVLEQRSTHLQKLFKFNPRKCNSASSFSGCVHRDKSMCLIALPTKAEDVILFEKILIRDFS